MHVMGITSLDEELPPRARRIPVSCHSGATYRGTTSACAENTEWYTRSGTANRNYLRVRGEYFTAAVALRIASELPPRARRIPVSGRNLFPLSGTTSACAENTGEVIFRLMPDGNYLRVRGEYNT